MSKLYRKKPMGEKVYNILRKEILENKLKPGEKLTEMEISNRLKVSRTPVREALKQLEQEGLANYYPRRGSVVSEISIQDALDFYEVREYLEGLALKKLCLETSRNDILELGKIISKMDGYIEEENYKPLYKIHVEWTEAIIELIENRYLREEMESILVNLDRYRGVSLFSEKHILQASKETRQIYEALEAGDEKKSEKLAMEHVRNARERFLENIEESKKRDKRMGV